MKNVVKKSTAAPRRALVPEVLPPAVPSLVIPHDVVVEARREGQKLVARLPSLVKIENESQLAAADRFRSTEVKPRLAELRARLDPIRANANALHKQIVQLVGELLYPYTSVDDAIKEAMERYAQEVLNRQKAEARRIEASRQAAAVEQAVLDAQDLIADGNDAAAQEILDRVAAGTVQPSTSMPAVVPRAPAMATSSVRVLRRFRVRDQAKLRPAFLMPDTAAIQAKINQCRSQGDADAVLGEGAVEYLEVANVGTRSS